jgi:hypothetical protein
MVFPQVTQYEGLGQTWRRLETPNVQFYCEKWSEAVRSGWALNFVAPKRLGRIYPLALFRRHTAAQEQGIVVCFLSDLWPEFSAWIQKDWTDMYQYRFYVRGVVFAEL